MSNMKMVKCKLISYYSSQDYADALLVFYLRVLSLFQAWQESGSKPKLWSDMSEQRLLECSCCQGCLTDVHIRVEARHAFRLVLRQSRNTLTRIMVLSALL